MRRWRRHPRILLWLLLACGMLLPLLYVLLLCVPRPLFPHELWEGTVVLHSPSRLPPSARALAVAVNARLARSPLYDPALLHHVYLCDVPWRFALFALHKAQAGGVTYPFFKGNIFIRPSHLERDRLLGPSGNEVAGDRTLTYFIAHEATHHLLAAHLGRWRYSRLSRWQDDGYADYVAKAGAFDFENERQRFLKDDPEFDPERSGLSLRYHLMVAQLLDRQKLRVDEMLHPSQNQSTVEAALRH